MKIKNLFAFAVLAIVAGLSTSISISAATYTVDRTDDATVSTCSAAPGDCTLRGAIAAANLTADNDSIDFDGSVFGSPQTITLGGTQLVIANSGTLTINGPGMYLLTVSGNNASRVFFVNSSATAAISNLAVTAARFTTANGGGIVASASSNVTLTNLRIFSNFAPSGGGIHALPGSTVSISGTVISNNTTFRAGGSLGGGLYNERGTVNINSSAISGNDSGYGGGLYNGGGSMTVTDSVVIGNTANYGAGVSNGAFFSSTNSRNGTLTVKGTTLNGNLASAYGGGFFNFVTNTTTIENSTISGNRGVFNGGGLVNEGTLFLNSVTASENTSNSGGGIYMDFGTATVSNTIIANSTTGGDCVRETDGTLNVSYSLMEGGLACVNGSNSNNLTGDPNLGPLTNNGGPTLTHALLSGSIAIDAGNTPSSALDQRGFSRTADLLAANVGDGTDIGAFEVQDSTPPVVSGTVSGTVGNDGWYVSDVVVEWTVSDDESPVSTSDGCAMQTIVTDTNGTTITCTATTAGGTASESVTFKRDATAPTLAPTVTPNPVLSGSPETAAANAVDSGSGLASQSCGTPDTVLIGSKSLTCTATDAAGNTANANVSYQVNSRFMFAGFFSPIENMPTVNIVNAGQSVPVKFSLGGNHGLAIFAAGYPASGTIPCDATEVGSTIEETYTAGGSTLSYDATTGQYSYTWKTDKAWKQSCRIFVLRLVDGSQYMAKFRFR